MNREYAETWPNITRKGEAPADADGWKDKPDKFEEVFSPNPAHARSTIAYWRFIGKHQAEPWIPAGGPIPTSLAGTPTDCVIFICSYVDRRLRLQGPLGAC